MPSRRSSERLAVCELGDGRRLELVSTATGLLVYPYEQSRRLGPIRVPKEVDKRVETVAAKAGVDQTVLAHDFVAALTAPGARS